MAPLLRAMIEHRATYHLRRDELTEYRMWRAATPRLRMGITSHSDDSLPQQQPKARATSISDARSFQENSFGGFRSRSRLSVLSERGRPSDVDDEGDHDSCNLDDVLVDEALAVKAFLLDYRFKHATDCGARGDGLPPLVCAAAEGNAVVVRALLEARADPNRGYCGRVVLPTLGLIPGGILPLHLAVGCCASQVVMHTLLVHGADPNATIGDVAVTPLGAGVSEDAAEGILNLHRACVKLAIGLDVEKGLESSHVSPLQFAAYASNPETVQALVEIGCNRSHVSDNGFSVFRCACENPRMDLSTLELLWKQGDGVDLNETAQPKSALWQALMTISEVATKCGGKVPFVGGLTKTFAHLRGSTPLHGAAKVGRFEVVSWLVQHGATSSLQTRTVSGATPLAFAKRGGHDAVAVFLNDAIAPPRARRQVHHPGAAGEYDA
jgi:ankyrin repeat protein